MWACVQNIAVITSVKPFAIEAKGVLRVNYGLLNFDAAREFAQRDGFRTLGQFLDFFRGGYGLPFVGEVVSWSVPCVDAVVYGVINFAMYDGYIDDWLAAGRYVWEAKNDYLFGIFPLAERCGVWNTQHPAEWIMTGRPESWGVYDAT